MDRVQSAVMICAIATVSLVILKALEHRRYSDLPSEYQYHQSNR
jgi:hypothetical protein